MVGGAGLGLQRGRRADGRGREAQRMRASGTRSGVEHDGAGIPHDHSGGHAGSHARREDDGHAGPRLDRDGGRRAVDPEVEDRGHAALEEWQRTTQAVDRPDASAETEATLVDREPDHAGSSAGGHPDADGGIRPELDVGGDDPVALSRKHHRPRRPEVDAAEQHDVVRTGRRVVDRPDLPLRQRLLPHGDLSHRGDEALLLVARHLVDRRREVGYQIGDLARELVFRPGNLAPARRKARWPGGQSRHAGRQPPARSRAAHERLHGARRTGGGGAQQQLDPRAGPEHGREPVQHGPGFRRIIHGPERGRRELSQADAIQDALRVGALGLRVVAGAPRPGCPLFRGAGAGAQGQQCGPQPLAGLHVAGQHTARVRHQRVRPREGPDRLLQALLRVRVEHALPNERTQVRSQRGHGALHQQRRRGRLGPDRDRPVEHRARKAQAHGVHRLAHLDNGSAEAGPAPIHHVHVDRGGKRQADLQAELAGSRGGGLGDHRVRSGDDGAHGEDGMSLPRFPVRHDVTRDRADAALELDREAFLEDHTHPSPGDFDATTCSMSG